MEIKDHIVTTGDALRRWFVAQSYDALAVATLWFVGLLILRVPGAPLWAIIAGVCQFVPNIGPVLGVAGPAIAAGLSSGWERMLYVLILYAIIVVVDGLFLQPYLMKRATRVPIWASLLAPIVLGIIIPFWGVLLAGPLLAVVYTFKGKRNALQQAPTVVGPRAFEVDAEPRRLPPTLDARQIGEAGQRGSRADPGLDDDLL